MSKELSKKEKKLLEVVVNEEIKIKEAPPGAQKESKLMKNEEKLPQEEIDKRQKVMSEYTRLLNRYCEPHNKKSRWVTKDDIKRVIADGSDLTALCNIPRGLYAGIAALAHSQIDDKDPLRFFVLQKGMVVINPVIFNHTKTPIEKNEGCLSFPLTPVKVGVLRYNKITVIYQTLEKNDNEDEPKLSKPIIEGLSSGVGHVFQHEISHLNGSNIYDDDYKPESCEGLGDGLITEEEAKKLFN